MYRKELEHLKKWKKSKNRKPLIIQGARGVGKTWLMQEFGKKSYKKCAYINLENNNRMKRLFEEKLQSNEIIQSLKIETEIDIDSKNTLIIFDEIQNCPNVQEVIKEISNNYNVIAATSVVKSGMFRNSIDVIDFEHMKKPKYTNKLEYPEDSKFINKFEHMEDSKPTEKSESTRDFNILQLEPLSFFEFLEVLGEKDLLKILLNNNLKLINFYNSKILQYLKLYYYIGGMPEVVNSYIQEKNLIKVRKIQNNILNSYEQYFSEYAPNRIARKVKEVWRCIPSQLEKDNKKFMYKFIKQGARAREYGSSLEWLSNYGFTNYVFGVVDNGIPLESYWNYGAYKVFLVDVGLLCAMANLNYKVILEENEIFEELNGGLTEQYIFNQLRHCTSKDIFYWASISGRSKVEFLLQIGNVNVPIEVQIKENLLAKGMREFVNQSYISDDATNTNNPNNNVRTSLSEYRKDKWYINVPLYSIGSIESIVAIK